MRIVNTTQQQTTLQEAFEHFLNFKKAQQVAPRTLHDYEYYLNDFLQNSHNSLDYNILTSDILSYLTNIPLKVLQDLIIPIKI